MKKSRLLICALLLLAANVACAEDKVFKNVVHHIESRYHVHHKYGFLMGFAGLVVKVSHVGGVKSFKAAIFENARLVNTGSDTEFDETVRAALDQGWQPVVQVVSKRDGQRSYIYAQPAGKDLKLLLATLEPTEAVVMQVKIDPDKLDEFLDQEKAMHTAPRRHAPEDTLDQETILAALAAEN